MKKKVRQTINGVLAAVGMAMGIAVIVLTTIGADVSTLDILRMLGIAAASLGILALNNDNANKAEE